MADGRVHVIEYSDLPDELAFATTEDCRLRFSAGSIAIHVLSRSFVERITADGKACLPFHRAEKKVPCVDEADRVVQLAREEAAGLVEGHELIQAANQRAKTITERAQREAELLKHEADEYARKVLLELRDQLGTLDGQIEALIKTLGSNRFWFQTTAYGADLRATKNPVTVGLAIGDDSGTASVNAVIK